MFRPVAELIPISRASHLARLDWEQQNIRGSTLGLSAIRYLWRSYRRYQQWAADGLLMNELTWSPPVCRTFGELRLSLFWSDCSRNSFASFPGKEFRAKWTTPLWAHRDTWREMFFFVHFRGSILDKSRDFVCIHRDQTGSGFLPASYTKEDGASVDIYIYIYIHGVTGGTDQTSGGCSLC